jgi:hypothetical protein
MGVPFLALVLDDPAEVRDAEVDRALYARKLMSSTKTIEPSSSSRPA